MNNVDGDPPFKERRMSLFELIGVCPLIPGYIGQVIEVTEDRNPTELRHSGDKEKTQIFILIFNPGIKSFQNLSIFQSLLQGRLFQIINNRLIISPIGQ